MKKRQARTELTQVVIGLPEGKAVRTTPDKQRVSVYDSIQAATGVKNPREVWERLKVQYPEVVGFTYSYKFPGRGQLPTPVTDKIGFARILALLPGEEAARFRQFQAPIVVRYLEGDITLADDIVQRTEDPEGLEWLIQRARGKKTRNQCTELIALHGGINVKGGANTYAEVTGCFNRGVLGNTAKTVQRYTGQKLTRDGLPALHLAMLNMTEQLFIHHVEHGHPHGHAALVAIGEQCASTAARLRAEHHIPAFPPTGGSRCHA
jgi:hypothetical protein